jgi:hypothetical protein
MKQFILKNNFWIMETLGLAVLLVLLFCWNSLVPTQRISGMFFVAIVLHVIEEMKLPGGFVDMVVKFTGMPVVNMDVPKFYLSLLIIYMALVPMFFPRVAFMGAAPLFLGVIEIFAHLLAAAKMNESHKFYSPGMVTSLLIMLPMTAYGFYTVISQHLVTGWNWLCAFLYLVIPLFGLQRYIIHSIGMDYRVFIGNALHALFGKGE